MSDIWFVSDTHFGHKNVIKYTLRTFLPDEGWRLYRFARQNPGQYDEGEYISTIEEKNWEDYMVPESCIEEHDETLINNWNNRISKKDTVYHLGDFCFGNKKEYAKEVLSRLNGQIYLIRGNHDKDNMIKHIANKVVWTRDLADIKIQDKEALHDKQNIVLCHFPLRVWNKSHYGSWHLTGHSHNSLKETKVDVYTGGLCLDVGVDSAAYYHYLKHGKVSNEYYTPYNYEEIKDIMREKQETIKRLSLDIYKDHHKP